ncbi:MAG: hypothetical protein KDC95_10215 [Planctomycetes bacterium]|nr:hypothetical protein [Planctomycetota bacterium]
MTSDEFENTQNGHEEDDLPIEERDHNDHDLNDHDLNDHDLNEDDYFVLEVEDEMSDVLDEDDGDDASSDFHETSDGFYATSSESGEEALFDDEFDEDANGEDLFADIDVAAAAEHIEAATEDVVDHEASFELDSSDDGEFFPGLGDEDEDADSRWQEEQELLDSTPEHGDDDFIESDLEDDFDSASQSAPAAPNLPPPGYRPPVANPMDYGTISSSQLRGVPESGQHSAPDHFHVINKPSESSDAGERDAEYPGVDPHDAETRGPAPGSFERDLLGSGDGAAFQQSSGNWAAVDSGEFHLVDHDADLASGNFSAVPLEEPSVEYEQPQAEATRQAWAASPQNETQYDSEYAPAQEGYAHESYGAQAYDEAANEGAEEYDPIYGAPRESEPVMAGDYQGQAGVRYGMAQDGSYDHLEEMVQDVVDDPSAEVIGGAPRHNRWARSFMTLTMAASVLVLGTVAFVTLRPDLPLAKKIRETLGLSVEERPPLEVADAPRPKVDTTFVVPRLDAVAGGSLPDATNPDTGSKTGTGTTKDPLANISERSKERYAALRDFAQWAGRTGGMMALRYAASRSGAADPATGTDRPTNDTSTTDPVAKGDPGTKTDPITTTEPNDPILGGPIPGRPDDVAKTPRTGTDSQRRNGANDTNPTRPQGGTDDVAKVPDGAAADETQRKNPPSIAGGPHGWGAGIMRGAQAFAQLQNGHFFVGRVQKVQEDELVMTWDQAEITFLPGDLQKLMPLASQEANILKGGPEGYVKLKNQNKIWGQILEDLPDVVTIQKGEHRIVIPKVAVAQVTKEKRAEIRLGKNDQDWSEDALPRVESDLPDVKVEPELQSGAIRVQLDTGTMKERSDHLRERIRRVFPVNPGR